MVPAHAFHDPAALGLPVPLVLYAAAALLVVGAVAVGRVARPPLEAAPRRRPPSGLLQASRALRPAAAALGLATFTVVVVSGLWGPVEGRPNLSPLVVLVLVPVGVVAASAFAGHLWPHVSPFVTLDRVGEWLATRRPAAGAVSSDRSGTASRSGTRRGEGAGPGRLGALLWVKHAYHEPGSARVVTVLLLAYTVVVLVGARRWGRQWLTYGEGVAALGEVAALLAPVGRDTTGRVVLRPPLSGLATSGLGPATASVAAGALGATAFGAITYTAWWTDLVGTSTGWALSALATAGLAWCVGTVAVAFVVTARWAERVGRPAARAPVSGYATVLVPLAVGFTLANQAAVALFSGRLALILASDPFGRGWDLLGTARDTVSVGLLTSPGALYLQMAAVLGGGLVAVVAAHDRSLALLGPAALRARTPVVAVAAVLTVTALALLLTG